MSEDLLFDMPEPTWRYLRLAAGKPISNYLRTRKGQNLKVNLRDLDTGKIVATVYGGLEMAQRIAQCVNHACGLDLKGDR